MDWRISRRGFVQALSVAGVAAMAGPVLAQDAKSVALVVTQKAGDEGPIDALIAGLGQAEAEMGVTTKVVEALDPATYETTVRALAQRGTNVIVTTFFGMGPVVQAVAAEFPDTRFVVIVGAPLDPALPNARVTVYATHENAYLSGLFGANVTQSKQLAYIGGVPLPFAWADYNAMTKAAQSVDPAITTSAAFVQSFSDPVKAREIAAGLYTTGVDAILTSASESDIGVVEAGKDAGKLVMPPSPVLIARAPESVGFVATFEWAATIKMEIANALSDSYESGFRIGNVKSGEIVVTYSDVYLASGDDAQKARVAAGQAAVQKAMDDILAGTLEVAYDDTAH